MGAFRFLALAYALAVFLIAPAWLAAEEEPVPTVPPPPVEEPAVAPEPVTTVAEPAPDAEAVADEADTLEAEPQADPEPAPEPEPVEKEKTTEAKEKEPTAKTSASASVTISDFKFTPSTVTVNEGDTVTWTNDGPTVHTATADDGSFDTGILEKGQSDSATFTTAGTINYFCEPHPFMKGKVVVQAASATGGDGSSGGSDSGGATAGEETTTSADDGSGLANTGGETMLIALLGVATLAAGMILRRRELRDR